MRDELTWSDANKGWPDREQALIKRNNQELQHYQQTGDNSAAYAAWLNAEVIPFYTQWQSQLAGLHRAPGRVTAGRAAVIGEVLRVKIAGCRELAQGVRTGNLSGITAYVRAEQEAIRLIRQLDRDNP